MSRTAREWNTSERFKFEGQDGSLSDGSQNGSSFSEELQEDSQDARDECFFYGANDPSRDESSISMLQELIKGKDEEGAEKRQQTHTQPLIQKQGPIKARRIIDSQLKETNTCTQSPAPKPQDRNALTEESKKDRRPNPANQQNPKPTDPFLAAEDQPQPSDHQKPRLESKLKRVNSKESIGSKKSTTSRRSKANSKRGSASGTGTHKMAMLIDVIKRNESRIMNSIPSLHNLEIDRPAKPQDNTTTCTSSMPLMFNNLINQTIHNASSLKQKTEQHAAHKEHHNLLLSDRRSPQKALKQSLLLATETLSKTAQANPPESPIWQSSTTKTKSRGGPSSLAKIFPSFPAQPDPNPALATSQVIAVSNEPQQTSNSTLLKSKIFSADKKHWFAALEKPSSDRKKPLSIFDSILTNTNTKDKTTDEDQAKSSTQHAATQDRKQPTVIKHLIEELKNKPTKPKPEPNTKKDKEDKDPKPKQKKQSDSAQKLSTLAFHLQSAVEN
jgi:hypothetical protein